jgi:hypothetical protein
MTRFVRRKSGSAGLTIMEVVVAMGLLLVVFGAVAYAMLGLQKSFSGSEHYFHGQADQTRMLDYIGTDVRRSLAVANGSTSITYNGTTYANTIPGGTTAILTTLLPNYVNDAVTPPRRRTPIVERSKVTYGNVPVRVTYFKQGSALYRLEVDPDVPAGDPRNTPRLIADDVADFALNITLPPSTSSLASARVTFAPKFTRQNRDASANPTSNTASRTATAVETTVQVRNTGLNIGLSSTPN